jgi:hypothetical protein
MRWPSRQEFRRHHAVEQGCSLPPPAPQASIILLPVRKLQIGREILSQNCVRKFHWNPEPRHAQSARRVHVVRLLHSEKSRKPLVPSH